MIIFLTTIGLLIMLKNLVFAQSNLIVIKQGDPDNNSKGYTYNTLDFLSRITTNAQYFLPIKWYCPQDCSEFKNSGFMYSTYYTYDEVPANEKCLGRARDCLTYQARSPYIESATLEQFWNWISSGFGADNEYYQLKVTQTRKRICPICRCYCDNSKKPNVANSFCLDVISSNVEEGYVVTGARFRIIDRVLRIQIQQGKLIDDQTIDSNTLEWQKFNNCKSTKKMSYDYRSLQMDDVPLPEGYFVTGLSFRQDNTFERIVLSVHGKQLRDLRNININAVEYWRPSDNRVNLITPDMDIPTAPQKKNTELSKPDKHYIGFQLPNFRVDIEDQFNELMPFLDIRDVVSDVAPLRGAGIYWRGQKGYGGFVAFKLFVQNYTTHLN